MPFPSFCELFVGGYIFSHGFLVILHNWCREDEPVVLRAAGLASIGIGEDCAQAARSKLRLHVHRIEMDHRAPDGWTSPRERPEHDCANFCCVTDDLFTRNQSDPRCAIELCVFAARFAITSTASPAITIPLKPAVSQSRAQRPIACLLLA